MYGRRDPVVTIAVVEETVAWKLAEFNDTVSGFANLTGDTADVAVETVVRKHMKEAAYALKDDKPE